MLEAMHRVGKSIRAVYYWLPRSKICYVVMDNAGGHGTDNAIEEYVRTLKDDWNVEVIFQIPRSPYTNALDLGVWVSLQSRVEKNHFGKRCEVNALVHSVQDTWDNGHLDEVITKVFERLRNVLVLIHEANGKNDLVETKRGKKFRNLDLPETDEPDILPEPCTAPLYAEEELEETEI